MGSSHKRATNENANLLDSDCSEDDMMSPRKYTVGFGGFHLAKALVNMMRNYVLQFDGQYCGVDILISLREECALLQQMKNAVFARKK